MRILLTGAAGFVGRAVRAELLAAGHDVVALDALLPSAHGSAPDVPPEVADGLHVADLADTDAVTRLLTGVDAVCHQAAMVGLGTGFDDAVDYVTHNAVATTSLLTAMARTGVRCLVQASSMVVYGPGRHRCVTHGRVTPPPRTAEDIAAGRYEPLCPACAAPTSWERVDESAPTDPRNVYAATKLAQEHLAIAWAEQTRGVAASLRYHNIYGPHLPRDTPYAGVASIFRSALARGEAPRVLEDGGQMRDFVHVADVARANRAALEALGGSAQRSGHRCWNVASGEPHTVGELATTLSRAVGGPAPVVVGGGRAGDVRHVVADAGRITADLGVAPRIRFAEGMAGFATDPLR